MNRGQGLRSCGRRWATEDAARCSKRFLAGGYGVVPCSACLGWHLAAPGAEVKAQAAPRVIEGFPERIRQQAIERDHGACIACGVDGALDVHHRRIRGMGGDSRPHTHCLCNAATVCRRLCHRWAHLRRREAQAQGFVVPRATLLPGSVSLMVHGAGGGGSALYPTCDGQWSSVPAVAA